ncbi:MAG: hypothetical protein HQL69_21355 [Magnetococcales bacterium]|nr:hypothetical protein [Magnetococcales bacterium]
MQVSAQRVVWNTLSVLTGDIGIKFCIIINVDHDYTSITLALLSGNH